jgi:hypothetical protein
MKKTYIEPKNTVVKISLETLIAQSPALTGTYNGGSVLSREVIDDPDALEEEW